MSKKATAVADVTEGLILASVEIDVSPERVFAAITASAEVVKWWGADQVYRTTGWLADVRPGGAWRADGVGADGVPFSVGGTFLKVDPPRTLVQTWQPSWETGEATTVTWRLEPIETGTRVTLHHAGFGARAEACRSHGDGWAMVLGWLGDYLVAPPPANFFFCRLLPPRPTFMLDLTADERAVMQAHAQYWRSQLAAGRAIVFGPVADPAGAWGLGVVRANTEAEVRAFEAADPAIAAARGFRYEITPMATAVF